MARMLALDWDGSEVRFLLGNVQRDKLRILDAGARPLDFIDHIDEEDETAPPRRESDIGGTLRALLAEHRVNKGVSSLLALSRSSVEIMHFDLPPASNAELPELVRNQAIRDSSVVDDRTPVDFMTTDDGINGENRRVTVIALPEERLSGLKSIASKAGVKARRMPLRSYAGASRFTRSPARTDSPCLLLNMVGNELDLTLLLRGKPLFSRTARLPDDGNAEKLVQHVAAEVNRTLAVAVQDEWTGVEALEKLFVFAASNEHRLLLEQLSDKIDLEIVTVDPFEGVLIEPTVIPTGETGRFASLVGMLLDEADGGTHLIDLLHPRKAPKPRSFTLPAIGVAVLGVLIAAGFFWMESNNLKQLEQSVAELEEYRAGLQAEFEKDQLQRNAIQGLRGWEYQGVNWLDEFRYLSYKMPSSEEFVATQIAFTSSQGGYGTIKFRGRAANSMVVAQMQSTFRDPYHSMKAPQVFAVQDSNYQAAIPDGTIVCRRAQSNLYLSALPIEMQRWSMASPEDYPIRPREGERPRIRGLSPLEEEEQTPEPTSTPLAPEASATVTPPEGTADPPLAPEPEAETPVEEAPAPSATVEPPSEASVNPPSRGDGSTRGRSGRSSPHNSREEDAA
jgi:hypothetical protein